MASVKTKCIYCESRDVENTNLEDDAIVVYCSECDESYEIEHDENSDDYTVIGE